MDGSNVNDRICFGVDVYEDKSDILFRIIQPNESPWAVTDLLGKMIDREEALKSSQIKEIYCLAELIVKNHEAITNYLEG